MYRHAINIALTALFFTGVGYFWGQGSVNTQFVAQKTAEQVAPVVAQKRAVEQKLQVVETKVLPKLQAQLNCQTNRADSATASAYGAGVPAEAIPNCPKPAAPPVASVPIR